MGRDLSAAGVGLADFEALAQQNLDANAWAYFAGAAGDETTAGANRAAWNALRLLPRVMRPLAGGDTGVDLLGRRWPTPLLLAPVAYQRLAHADGEIASALAASAQATGVVLSAQASVPLEQVARVVLDEPGRGPLWFQIYLQPDRGFTREVAQRARAAGFEALVLTVDAPLHGVRDRERAAGFRLPPAVSAVNLAGAAPEAPVASRFDYAASHAPAWADIAWLASTTGLPVIVKGVLHPDDAVQARDAGAAALIVSNHGGRTLDTVPDTATMLPRIADRLAGTLPLLVDGGLRRGTDVLKAIALGASAVLLGRPQVFALAAGGAPAVAQMLRLLRDELEIAMALSGCRTLADAGRSLIFDAPDRSGLRS